MFWTIAAAAGILVLGIFALRVLAAGRRLRDEINRIARK